MNDDSQKPPPNVPTESPPGMQDSTVIWPKATAGGSAGGTGGGSEKASSGPAADLPTEASAELETLRSRLVQLSKRLAEQDEHVSGVANPAE